MRNLKKVLSLALALVMLLGMMMIGAGAATTKADLSEANQEAIAVLKATKVMTNTRYDDPVTRAEAAKMVLTIYNPDLAKGVKNTKDSAYFSDVKNHWAAGYIDLCFSTGIVSGRSKNVFDPNGSVTGYELAKMVMVAMGKTTKYTGSTWTSKVMADATELKLSADAKISNWNKPVTRLQAAQLTFNGLTKNVNGEMKYVVKTSSTTYYNGDDYEIAKLILAVNSSQAGITIEATPSDKGSLADTNFNMTKTTKPDGFGHNIDIWKMGDKEVWAASTFTSTAAKTFTYTKATTNDLKDADFMAASSNEIVKIEDGKTVTGLNNSGAAAAVINLTGDSSIVELYKDNNGKYNKVVVINLYAGKVTETKATATTKRTIGIDNDSTLNALETEDFAKDEIVLYNKSWDGSSKYDLKNVAAAPSFEGEMTSINKAGTKFTIGGTVYEVAVAAGTVGSFDAAAMKAVTKGTYYLAPSGKVVFAASETPAETNTGNYAVIISAHAELKAAAWPATEKSVTLQVNALLSDGTMGIFTVDGVKFTAGNGNDVKDKAEVTIGSDKVNLLKSDGTAIDGTDGDVTAKLPGVYDYALDGDKIKLNSAVAALTGSETEDCIALDTVATSKTITKANVVADGTIAATNKIIVNNKTVFVLKSADGKAGKMITGAAALENTTIPAGSQVVVGVKNGDPSDTLTAKVVFAKGTNFSAATATATGVYVYLDGDFSKSLAQNADKTYTYTFSGMSSNGEKINVTKNLSDASDDAAAKAITAGVYAVNDDGTLGDKSDAAKVAVTVYGDGVLAVGADAGNGKTAFTVPETAKIVTAEDGAELKAGAQVYIVWNASVATQADIIFVLKPAA